MSDGASRPCPLCFNRSVEEIYGIRFVLYEGHPLSPDYRVVVCGDCGFAYADVTATSADYDRYYAQFSKYEDTKTSTGGGEHPLDAERLKETAELIARVVPDRSAAVLDMGCANGGLLVALRDLGYTNLTGIDPAPACVRLVRETDGITGRVGNLFGWPPEVGRFDLVILSHVLEHVLDLDEALLSIKKLTRPDGVVYIEVPDAQRYADFILAPFQDFNSEHINHFSLGTLSNWMARNGYEAVHEELRTLAMPPAFTYPAVSGFYRGNAVRRDNALEASLGRYVQTSQQILDELLERIETQLAHQSTIIVWGTGQMALKLLAEPILRRKTVAVYVDGNPINQGKSIEGVKVVAPEEIRNLTYPIVIMTTIHHKAIEETIRTTLGLTNQVVVLAD